MYNHFSLVLPTRVSRIARRAAVAATTLPARVVPWMWYFRGAVIATNLKKSDNNKLI